MSHSTSTKTASSQDATYEFHPAYIYGPCIGLGIVAFIGLSLLVYDTSPKRRRHNIDREKVLLDDYFTFLRFWRGEFFLFPLFFLLNYIALLLFPVGLVLGLFAFLVSWVLFIPFFLCEHAGIRTCCGKDMSKEGRNLEAGEGDDGEASGECCWMPFRRVFGRKRGQAAGERDIVTQPPGREGHMVVTCPWGVVTGGR
ncbi:hypothetical protein QBC41DRAFT_304303 [Cercophora samala]|uniref:Uncharacterized protein n=1 Tax=Cercophora samala TaxID=330535 RepID=A0AA39ZAR7_9PEZI|nr:hypothetical protein QBC41DRAFT_304303 [Cercophora samala]